MTLEELDAEHARMRAHLRWLREDAIAELTAELENETNPYHREFFLQQIEKYRAMKVS